MLLKSPASQKRSSYLFSLSLSLSIPRCKKKSKIKESPFLHLQVSLILSGGRFNTTRGPSKFNPIFNFSATIQGQQCDMVFTSVTGHLMELNFEPPYTKWSSCRDEQLFDIGIVKQVPNEKRQLKQQLEQEARKAAWLILWLDCDREGENIAFEVV